MERIRHKKIPSAIISMYWTIIVYYNNEEGYPFQGRTCHIIKAKSKREALRTREKYGISYPMNSERVRKVECIKIDSRLKINKIRLHYKKTSCRRFYLV